MKRTTIYLPPICWVSRPYDLRAEISEGFDLCPTCAEKEVSKYRAMFPKQADEISGGGGVDYGHETDYPAACSECGDPLASYVLETRRAVYTLKQWNKHP